ncbi:MAG TPA: hypothetical protein VIF37_19010 [Methylobacter sp.]
MTSPIEIVTALPEVAKAIYSDIVSSTLQEIGKIGVDAVKTFRLALFPLQISAALQDRLALYTPNGLFFGFTFGENIVKEQKTNALNAHDYPRTDRKTTGRTL